MASRTSKTETDQPVIRMADLAAQIAARRAELNLPHHGHPEHVEGLRNAGANRTESKRALLKAIKDAGGEW